MKSRSRLTGLFCLLILPTVSGGPATGQESEIPAGVEQLRHDVGKWSVTTELLNPDGSVAQAFEGTYRFDWVVPDRVLIGETRNPELGPPSGILYYYRESDQTIEQVSVGADGELWILSGPADGNVRTSQPKVRPNGSTIQLRFTHYNIEPERFESKMEVTSDGGVTWVPGNHQVLTRISGEDATEAPAPPSWETLPAWLDAQADAGFTGAVLVVRDGRVVVDRGYGLANRRLALPITPDTIFATGSLPIDYTHAAILKLAQESKLDLTDPITEFFDNVPADKRATTVEHLMTGGSGLPDFHDLPGDGDPDHSWIDRDEAIRRIFAQELLFPPGDGDEHSHSAWGVLAAIVEIVSGQSYQEYTRTNLFQPAGMVDTGFNGEPVPAERLAIGYGPAADGEVNAPPWWGETSWLVLGSGGQTGTTRDTGRWLEAMRDGKVLEPEWAERYFGPGVGANRNGDNYGYEMFVYHSPMAGSYVVTLTNANKPTPDSDGETHFVRVSRALGELLIKPYLPKFRLGLGIDREAGGVAVAGMVVPGSAAARDGLKEGDQLLSAGGVALDDDPMAVLDPYLKSGDPVVFRVRRDGEEIEITVRPDPR